MATRKSILLGAVMLVGATIAANAQSQYPAPPQIASNPYGQAYQPYPNNYAPTTPPSWSYSPYTSGLGPCPQRGPGDEPCSDRIFPTYGQPNFWVR
jgi:hypothetical protein